MQVNQLGMVIDSTAGTPLTRYSGDPRQTDFLQYDITNLAHYAKKNANVLVVGVGGGRDILSALEFDQRHVTGVEINGDILDLTNKTYGDFTGHLDRNPKVTFVNDEARSWVTRTKNRFDMIQISLIDTWAATSSGAYALSENSLYTTQAFNTFFNRLKPGGIFSVSRWYSIAGSDKPLEIYRTTALAAQVLTDRGVKNPRDHILIYHGPKFGFGNSAATVLMSPQGFSKAELATIEAQAARLQFVPVLTPETRHRPALRRPRQAWRAREGGGRLHRGHPAPHRRPPVLLPDGRPEHVDQQGGAEEQPGHPASAGAGHARPDRAGHGRLLHRPSARARPKEPAGAASSDGALLPRTSPGSGSASC